MIPSEKIRNNQRFIPLTAELIQDMLDNEGLEFQTPPGGHPCELGDNSFPNMNHNNANQPRRLRKRHAYKETTPSDNTEPNSLERICHHYHHHHQQRRHRKANVLKTGSSPGYISTSDDEPSNWESVINVMRSVERLNKIRESEIELDTSNSSINNVETELSSTSSKEYLSTRPSRRRLICSSSDSLISKPSYHLEEIRDRSLDNFLTKNQHWINVVVVPKSETSFLMNQYKLENLKISSCNTYYTPGEEDLRRDREAAASLLARPISQRNSRNVHF